MTTALVPRPQAGISLDERLRYAETLAKAGLLPAAFRNRPADVLVGIELGEALGLAPIQAMLSIHVIEGRPSISADLAVALCLRSGECEHFSLVESTDKIATFETKRRNAPAPVRLSYTMEQAKRAGLAGRNTWQQHPESMLRARAKSALARLVYPDVIGGLLSPEEQEETTTTTAPPSRPAVVTRVQEAVVDAEVVEPDVGRWLEAIASAGDEDTLAAIGAEIKAAGVPREAVLAPYQARMAELRGVR